MWALRAHWNARNANRKQKITDYFKTTASLVSLLRVQIQTTSNFVTGVDETYVNSLPLSVPTPPPTCLSRALIYFQYTTPAVIKTTAEPEATAPQ